MTEEPRYRAPDATHPVTGPGTPGPHGPSAAGPGGPSAAGPGGPSTAGPGGPPGPSWPAPAPAPAGRRPRAMTGIVAAALVAGLVGGGTGFAGAYAVLDDGPAAVAAPTLTGTPASNPVAAVPGTVAGAAEIARPSTVDIRVVTPQGAAEGSGVVLTVDGAVLTNHHVVAAGRDGRITVTLADGTEYAATVLGAAPSYDLAVLRLEGASGLTPAGLGRSADVGVGQQVVAIGSPQGLTGTVTTGIVSALGRTVAVPGEDGSAVVYNGLQTDAPINPGNSGGPLVNLEGQVVGINSAIATAGQSTGSIGLGFAIPVDQARRVAQEILDGGPATKPVLGVQGAPGGTGAGAGERGAVLAAVQEGSPAAGAGLAPGDTIVRVGDAAVEGFTDLVAKIGAQTPGGTVPLTVRDASGAERTVEVTLGSTPDTAATTSPGPGGREWRGGR